MNKIKMGFLISIFLLASILPAYSFTDAQINQVCTEIGGTNKATMLIRPGTWTISNNVTCTSNISWKVETGATIAVADGKRIIINAASVDTKMDFQLDGKITSASVTNQATPGYGLVIVADNVTLHGSGSFEGPGTYATNEHTTDNCAGLLKITGDHVTVKGITFKNPPSIGIYLSNSHKSIITKNKFTGGPVAEAVDTGGSSVGLAQGQQHYYIANEGGSTGILIDGNEFYMDTTTLGAARQGVQTGGSSEHYSLSVINNNFKDILEHAVYVTANGSNCSNNTVRYTRAAAYQLGNAIKFHGKRNIISGNNLYNALTGGITSYNAVGTIISHNNIYESGYVGVLITNDGTIAYGLNYNQIIGNLIIASASSADYVYQGIRYETSADVTTSSYGGKINGNTIIGWGESTSTEDAASLRVWTYTDAYKMYNFEVNNNTIEGSTAAVTYARNVRDSQFNNNIIRNALANRGGMLFRDCTGIDVENNKLTEINGNAISFVNISTTQNLSNNRIRNNYLVASADSAQSGIYYATIENTSVNSDGIEIEGNRIIDFGFSGGGTDKASIFVSAGSATPQKNFRYVSISKNKISGSKTYGIVTNDVINSTIARNHIFDNPYNGTVGFYAVYVDGGTGIKFEGNLIEDNQTTPTLSYAFLTTGSSSNILLLNNESYSTSQNSSPFGHAAASNIVGRGNKTSRSYELTGGFNLNNTASTVVTNANLIDNVLTDAISSIIITPLNAAGATLQGGVQHLYVSATSISSAFTVTTADGLAAPASAANFAYEIIQ